MAGYHQPSVVFIPLILVLMGVFFSLRFFSHRDVGNIEGKRRFKKGAGMLGVVLLVLGIALLVRKNSGNNEPPPSTQPGIQAQFQSNGHSNESVSSLSPSSQAPASISPWMPAKDLDVEIKNQKAKGFYPNRLEGRCPSGKVEFRATFSPIPTNGFEYVYFLGHSEATFQKASNRIREGGFRLVNSQSFTNQSGEVKYQSVWVKRAP